jgi:hypothetical protein
MFTLSIDLDYKDLSEIAWIAHKRAAHQTERGIPMRNVDKNYSDPFHFHHLGVKGEKAVSKIIGVPVDRETYDHGDPGYDFIYAGRTLDVKMFGFTGSNVEFYIQSDNHFTADIGIGVQNICDTRVRILGWITHKNFHKLAHWSDYGAGLGRQLAVHGWELIPIEEILTLGESHGKRVTGIDSHGSSARGHGSHRTLLRGQQ